MVRPSKAVIRLVSSGIPKCLALPGNRMRLEDQAACGARHCRSSVFPVDLDMEDIGAVDAEWLFRGLALYEFRRVEVNTIRAPRRTRPSRSPPQE